MKPKSILPLALVVASTVALTGCAGLMDQLRNESSKDFESKADLDGNWGKSADWLPEDATQILIRESTNGDPAILLATSGSDLDAANCIETERRSLPVFDVDWSPDPLVERVQVCGEWAVIPTDEGWFGWTPIDPDESAVSPR